MGAFDPRIISITPTGTGAPGSPGANNGANASLLKQLLASLNGQSAAANAAGEAQYGSLMSSVGDTKNAVSGNYASALGQLGDAGQSALSDINRTLASNNAKTEQDTISRGIGNTSIRSNLLQGNEESAQRSRNSVYESVGAQKAGVLQNQAGANLSLGNLSADSILSKRIESPDQGAYLNLLSQLGQTVGQGGGTLGNLNLPGASGGTGGGGSGYNISPGQLGASAPPGATAGGGAGNGGTGSYFANPGARGTSPSGPAAPGGGSVLNGVNGYGGPKTDAQDAGKVNALAQQLFAQAQARDPSVGRSSSPMDFQTRAYQLILNNGH